MSNIDWSQEKFKIEDYISSWQQYITTKALWYSEISNDVKESPEFHEELAIRINKIIERILEDPPTDEQIATIQIMQEKLNTHYEYECKAQAVYVERLLESHLNNMK